MSAPTGKDHARINLGIWGDDDFRDLTPPEQHLYFVLWTSPTLTYCGAGDWHPGRLAQLAGNWTRSSVEQAAAGLSRKLFLLIDADTDEYLLRSWIKHDGLWRTPNMAVSVANARAALASRNLRGAVVHEVLKIREKHPDSGSWKRNAVVSMLEQSPVDPAELEPFNPPPNPGSNPPSNPPANPGPNPWVEIGANPPSTPTPTPTPLLPPTPESYTHASNRRPATPIPDDWTPNDVHRAKLGKLPAGVDLEAEAEAFRNHALSVDRRQANWDAAFHNWLAKARPREKPGVGAATTKAQGWLALADQLPPDPDPERRAIS